MFVFFVNTLLQNTMAEQNVPSQPPTRTDEQIVPRSQWLIIGKSNLLFNAQKIQKNPIFQISVDILSNTNFFRAFTASAITSSSNTVIDFVNELGYPEPVEIVSNIRVNYVYQPWRAILTLINQCLTGKTSGSDKPRHPVLQMLWGIVTKYMLIQAELLGRRVYEGYPDIFLNNASNKSQSKGPKEEKYSLLILMDCFQGDNLLLASKNNILRRPDSYCMSWKAHQEQGEGRRCEADGNELLSLAGSSFCHKFRHSPKFATGPSSQPEDDTSEKVIHESSSTSDSELRRKCTSQLPEKAHEALAGPDPKPMQEDQTGSNSGKLHVSLAGPNPEHMDDEFLATAYPKVHENLKLITDECVIEENPESHSGSMSSMKNLDDTYNFGDQFLYDKPTEDDQEKSKVIKESNSTIPDPSH
ncbi:hypothetical protein Tco_1420889 [Tanacetum coccineum]